jgi:hypothetical protein
VIYTAVGRRYFFMKKLLAFGSLFVYLAVSVDIYAQSVELDTGIRRGAEYFEQQLQSGTVIAILNLSSDSWALSDYIIDGLSKHFVSRRYLTVVERRHLDIVQLEVDYQLSGEVSDETAQSIGHRVGAQTVILGSIRPLGAEYSLDLRAISVETGVIQGMFRQIIQSNRIQNCGNITGFIWAPGSE